MYYVEYLDYNKEIHRVEFQDLSSALEYCIESETDEEHWAKLYHMDGQLIRQY